MKILVYPDIHGNKDWKDIMSSKINEVDKVIFLGDYVDSFKEEERGEASAKNLEDIIAFAKQRKDKVQLLVGNHDLSYCSFNGGANPHISGHQMFEIERFNEIFKTNKKWFKVAVKYGKWIFSHAGFTKSWYNTAKAWFTVCQPEIKAPNGAMNLANWLWKTNFCGHLDFSDHDWSGFGNSNVQGPLWVRPAPAFDDAYYKYQVVGHTEVKDDKPLLMSSTNKRKALLVCDHQSHNIPFILDTEWSIDDLSDKCSTTIKDHFDY